MKKKFFRLLGAVLFAVFALANIAAAADLSRLVLLHTNDTHGYDYRDAQEETNGIPAIAALKKSLTEQGYTVFLLDAGDAIQDNNLVNLSQGQTLVQFFNAAGYDAATFGNHEFDYGQAALAERMAEANYPYVCANIIVDATGKTLSPAGSVLLEKDGIKVGVFGLTTPSTKTGTHPKNVRGLTFLEREELYAAAQKEIDALRAQGADVVVCLSHLGGEPSDIGNTSDDVMQNVTGLDLLFDGHDHLIKNDVVNGVARAETGCYTKTVGIARLMQDRWRTNLIPYGVLQPKDDDKAVTKIVSDAQKAVDKQLARKISATSVTLDGNRDPGVRTHETNLGDFVADAYLWQANKINSGAKVDAALLNGGSLRYSIMAGTIQEGDLRRTLPYGNILCVMTISGAKLHEILEAATCTTPEAMGPFPQVAGIEFSIDTTKPFIPTERYPNSDYYAPSKNSQRVTVKSVGGQPFDAKAMYRIVTTTFIASGGDAYGGLLTDENGQPFAPSALAPLTGPKTEDLVMPDLEAVMNYINYLAEEKISIGEAYPAAEGAGRIVVVK